jgi:hypothetical protein
MLGHRHKIREIHGPVSIGVGGMVLHVIPIFKRRRAIEQKPRPAVGDDIQLVVAGDRNSHSPGDAGGKEAGHGGRGVGWVGGPLQFTAGIVKRTCHLFSLLVLIGNPFRSQRFDLRRKKQAANPHITIAAYGNFTETKQ